MECSTWYEMTATTTVANPTDADLVERTRAGDAGAFALLVERHQRTVLAVAASLLSDRTEAQDVAQETFLRAYLNLGLLADPSRFGAWVKRVAFGASIDSFRRVRSEARLGTQSDIDGAVEILSDAPSPLETLERRELADRVLDAVAALPPRYRVPLTMFHLDGLSHAKVANALDMPVSTVRSLVTRARQRLALTLQTYANSTEMLSSNDIDVFEEQRTPRMLHVLNGDSVRGTMEQSAIPGTLTVWADVMHEGPLPRDVSDEEFSEIRARYIGSRDYVDLEMARATEEKWRKALESYSDYDEVVLWFEHDLFDQLLLVHHLDFFARRDLASAKTTLSLICIGEYPGVPKFDGLGQLAADQLTSLLDTRQRVTVRQTELGRAAWRALTGDDPRAIEKLLERDMSALPFLPGALVRFLEEYPSLDQGLPRSERQLLEVLAERGPSTPSELFVAQSWKEERVYQGDWSIWKKLEDLSDARAPLVTHRIPDFFAPDIVNSKERIDITPMGRSVLAGERDWTDLRPMDRWLGGVHLHGHSPRWRWDRQARRIVVAGSE